MNINELYMNVFPLSHVAVSKGCLGETNTLYIKGFIQNPDEWGNGISHNDPLNFMATYNPVTNVYKEENLCLTIKPTNPHMAYGSVKLRKKTIKNLTPEKLTARLKQIKEFIKVNVPNMVHDIKTKV